jgi:hypothetical protein
MHTLYTFGDSILDCRMYNEFHVDPGGLLVRNDDDLFPEFREKDLTSHGPAQLEHRAIDGSTVEDLAAQGWDIIRNDSSVALLTIGGNDLIAGLAEDRGSGIRVFARSLDAFLSSLVIRPVLIGTVYDPTSGDDTQNFLGVDPAVARLNFNRVNEVLAEAAACYGSLVDLHAHFLTGDSSWYTRIIEPSWRGASEIRRCFLTHVFTAFGIAQRA